MYVTARGQPCKLKERSSQHSYDSYIESSNNSVFNFECISYVQISDRIDEPSLFINNSSGRRINESSQSYLENGFQTMGRSSVNVLSMDDRTFNSLHSSNNDLYRSLSSRSIDNKQCNYDCIGVFLFLTSTP